MASIPVLHQCSKCRETNETVICGGCQNFFCKRHAADHRKELSTTFNQHLLVHDRVLSRLLVKQIYNESSRAAILSQINQWENDMIERVRYKAQVARERLNHLTGKHEEIIIKDAQQLVKKIDQKNRTNHLLENDIERLKQNIDRVKKSLIKLTSQPDVELYIEPNHMIDWNHLIYVREKSIRTASTLFNKQSTNKDWDDMDNLTTSTQQQAATSHSESESSSSSTSSDDGSDAEGVGSNDDCYPFEHRVSDEYISSSTQKKPSPLELEKQVSSQSVSTTLPEFQTQTKRPLSIVETLSRSPTVDINSTSSEVRSTSETTISSSLGIGRGKCKDNPSERLAELLRRDRKT